MKSVNMLFLKIEELCLKWEEQQLGYYIVINILFYINYFNYPVLTKKMKTLLSTMYKYSYIIRKSNATNINIIKNERH